MPFIPNLGETPDTEDWSESQVQTFIVCTYLILTAYFTVLLLAASNFFQFIFAQAKSSSGHGNQNICNHPLLVFYILVALCLVADLIYSIFIISMETCYAPFLSYIPPTLKFLIGVEQIWMIIEFIFHLNFSIKIAGIDDQDMTMRLTQKNQQKHVERIIRIGRCCITLLIIIVIFAITSLCFTKLGGSEEEFEADYPPFRIVFSVAFVTLIIGLLVTVLLLRYFMNLKNRIL